MDKDIWIPITEYSQIKGLSVSTVRRYIRSNSVKSKKERGKYFISTNTNSLKAQSDELSLKMKVRQFELQLNTLQEENSDLRMLVEIYEKQLNTLNNQPPAMP